MSQTSGFIQLDHEGVLAVRGADAKSFLQGQLTCNMDYIDQQGSSLGARCNPKGRMQSSFRIIPEGDGYLLAMDLPLVELQVKEISKFAVFSKSAISNESADWLRFGLINAQECLAELGIELDTRANALNRHNDCIAVRVSDNLVELWQRKNATPCLHKRLQGMLPELALNDWQLQLIRCGIGFVSMANYEEFIPQMLNLPALDAVSFKKGCYSGQEIVARMQYLGKLKRHMFRFSMPGTSCPQTGSKLLDAQDKNIGELVGCASTGSNLEFLAVALEQAVTGQQITLDGQPATLLDLPYQVDAEREINR